MESLRIVVFLFVGMCAIASACASIREEPAPLAVAKPTTWTRDVAKHPKRAESRGRLWDHLLCHPEPTHLLNTTLSVRSYESQYRTPGYARELLDRILVQTRSKGRDVSMTVPIQSSELAGHAVLEMQIDYSFESRHDGSTVRVNARYWAIPLRTQVVVMRAAQPIIPDPECSADLEEAIRTLRITPAA